MNESPNTNASESAGIPRVLTSADGSVAPGEVFRFLTTYWIYQDQIGWSRIQTLVAVEAAVLAGSFARRGPLSPLVLLLGTLLIEWIYRVIRRDWQIRDYLGHQLDRVTQDYGLHLIPEAEKHTLRGRIFIGRTFWGLATLNLLLALVRAYQALAGASSPSLSWLLR